MTHRPRAAPGTSHDTHPPLVRPASPCSAPAQTPVDLAALDRLLRDCSQVSPAKRRLVVGRFVIGAGAGFGTRLILDLSSPRETSINDGINPKEYRTSYNTIDEAVRLLFTMGGKAGYEYLLNWTSAPHSKSSPCGQISGDYSDSAGTAPTISNQP